MNARLAQRAHLSGPPGQLAQVGWLITLGGQYQLMISLIGN
jgi:hypothetical protein